MINEPGKEAYQLSILTPGTADGYTLHSKTRSLLATLRASVRVSTSPLRQKQNFWHGSRALSGPEGLGGGRAVARGVAEGRSRLILGWGGSSLAFNVQGVPKCVPAFKLLSHAPVITRRI